MADFDHLPTDFDANRTDTRWIPKLYLELPSFWPHTNHIEAKDALNKYYAVEGFTISIDKPQYKLPSKFNPVKYVKACSLRCAHGREYRKKSSGKRPHTSTAMTGCEWRGRLEFGCDLETGEEGYSFAVLVPHHNHDR